MMNRVDKLKAIGNQLLPVIAYGDAAGLPFEGRTMFPVSGLDRLQDTVSNPYIGQYPAGTWSDDTHLSLAVAQGLIQDNGFSIESQARAHVTALEHVEG